MSLPPLIEYASQAILPTRFLSTLIHSFTQIENTTIKNASIDFILRHFDVNMDEASEPDPHAYPSFNAFFTRTLKPGARPLADEPALLSPVDGRISQWGKIDHETIFQAKGRSYTATALLGDEQAAQPYQDGQFATIYLAPNNYHRIHVPLTARLVSAKFVPGRLFSVQPSTAQAIDALFARNERLVLHFESKHGPFALVMVGALLVGSMETVVEGKISPPHMRSVKDFDYSDQDLQFARGDEIGRFNMGSTVVLLFPPGPLQLNQNLGPSEPVQLGQMLGQWQTE
ncbi:MAG: archaetidylserine decarboxylase [Oceanococcus sp.]